MVLRFLLRNWLHGVAGEKIREQAVGAAREKIAEMQRGPQREKAGEAPRGDDLAADVGIIFALAIEAGGTADILGEFSTTRGHGFIARRGRLHERSVVLVESGAGGRRAAEATEAVIEACRPRWIISAGFAGGLVAGLKRYDIVVADSVTDIEGTAMEVDLEIDRGKLPGGARVGRVLSVAEIARRPSEKKALGERCRALAVDLESLAVAEVCRRRGVKFMGVRVITDAMDEQLPADVQYLTEQATPAARLGAALGSVIRRPASFKDMWQLKETALIGSDRLGGFLEGIIRELR